jgi:hypothetical protein
MTMVVEQPLPRGAGAGDTSVSSHSEQVGHLLVAAVSSC